jgi:hypothetical protein
MRFGAIFLLLPFGLLLLFGRTLQASTLPLYYLTTGQTGAQTQIDINHSSEWSFTPTIPWRFGGGFFEMKEGSKTTAPITFRLYQGRGASTVGLIAQVTLTNAQFCSQAPCQQYNIRDFQLVSPVTLAPGVAYYASLTSAAPDRQSEAYFIKASTNFRIVDANGGMITPPPIESPSSNDVPEPSSLLLTGFGGLALYRWRPRKPA